MRTIFIGNVEQSLPEEWNELTIAQLEYLAQLVIDGKKPHDIRLYMFLYCCKMIVFQQTDDGAVIIHRKEKVEVDTDSLLAACSAFDFLFDESGDRLEPRLTRNPYPRIFSTTHLVYGPAEAMTDIIYEQFIMLQTYLEQYLSGDADAINQFIATIWRRKSEKYDSEKIHPDRFNRLPEVRKMIILWYYYGTIGFLEEKFPLTFAGGESSGGSAFENQMRVVNALAKGVASEKEANRKSLMYDVFYTIECAMEDRPKESY